MKKRGFTRPPLFGSAMRRAHADSYKMACTGRSARFLSHKFRHVDDACAFRTQMLFLTISSTLFFFFCVFLNLRHQQNKKQKFKFPKKKLRECVGSSEENIE